MTLERTLVARHWHGRLPTVHADDYRDHLERTGLVALRSAPGNEGVLLIRRTAGTVTHFDLFSFWSSMDALLGFAGGEPSRARYFALDDAYLLELEPTCTHFPWRGLSPGLPPLRKDGAVGVEFLAALPPDPAAPDGRRRAGVAGPEPLSASIEGR